MSAKPLCWEAVASGLRADAVVDAQTWRGPGSDRGAIRSLDGKTHDVVSTWVRGGWAAREVAMIDRNQCDLPPKSTNQQTECPLGVTHGQHSVVGRRWSGPSLPASRARLGAVNFRFTAETEQSLSGKAIFRVSTCSAVEHQQEPLLLVGIRQCAEDDRQRGGQFLYCVIPLLQLAHDQAGSAAKFVRRGWGGPE